MPKVNFTKVEDALAEGMRKLSVEKLIDLADDPQTKGKVQVKLGDLSPSAALPTEKLVLQKKRSELCLVLRKQIEKIAQNNPSIWSELDISSELLEKAIDKPEKFKKAFWKKIDSVKVAIDKMNIDESENEKIIEEQRKVHINKRFNTNKHWLPLH